MAMIERSRESVQLQFIFENRRPIDVTDLGRSLEALGEQYEEFVLESGREIPPINARLYIEDIRSGSIIVTLKSLLDQASFILDHIDTFAGFVGNLNDIIQFLLLQDKVKKPTAVTTGSVERITAILDPVAKDSGSNLVINVTGNTAPVMIKNVFVNSEKANAIQNGARRFLGARLPSQGRFESELMYLDQMKGDAKSKTGDRGVIEKFSAKPVKLQFMSPQVKARIVDQPENPFKLAYIVDGEVSTVSGAPALYKIYEVHDAIDKP